MKYFYNTSWMFAEQILRIITGLIIGVWVARYLGPEQFGIFSYVFAFSTIFTGIAKLGLDSIIVRDLVNEPDQSNIYLGTAFWLKFMGAFFTLAIIAFATLFIANDNTTNLYIFIIASGTIFQSFEVIDFYFQSRVLSKYVSLCKITQLFISSALKLYFILTDADLFYFVVVILIDQLTLAITLYIAYNYQKIGVFYLKFDVSLAKKLLKYSWPLILTSIISMVQARIDQVMLKEMIGNTELGYYSSAMRLIEVFGFIPVILTNSLFPAIVNAKNISMRLYTTRLFNFYRFMMLLFLCVAIPVYFFGEQIIVLLYKNAYAPAGHLFSLMAIRLFFTNYGIARNAYLMTENLITYSMITMAIGAIVNITLNYIWIPDYHSIGAIWASIASFFISIFLIDIFYYKTKENVKLRIKSILIFLN
jgi:O-antigen/teichoic acid export membrane protein